MEMSNPCIFELFAEQAFKSPNKMAVVFGDKMLTYHELYQKAFGLASNLTEKKVRAGDIVCIHMPNSLEYVVSVLALLQIGAICLPIDSRYPKRRIEYILEDSKAKAILVTEKTINNIDTGVVKINVDIDKIEFSGQTVQEEESNSHKLAYCIYTSGSTGEPKGVLLHEKGIINHMFAKIRDLEIDANDILCQSLSISFVASIWQILSPIVLGAQLIIYDEDTISNIYELFKKVTRDGVNIISITPSTLNAYLSLVRDERRKLSLDSLKAMVVTGEKLTPSLVNSYYEEYNIPLFNAYGQTECSDDTLHYKIPYSTETKHVPIGKPIANTKVYILDEQLNAVPEGNIGELYISGNGLAKGYLNRPELTAERFIPDPFEKSERIFKTGDLVRLLPDGNIEYIGRVDNQVKIRGHRIELEEIEAHLLNCKSVKQAVVIAKEDKENTKYLCAYFVAAEDGEVAISDLRNYLSNTLPNYMVPRYFIKLEKFPQTENGKINRNALPDPEPEMNLKSDNRMGNTKNDHIYLKVEGIIRDKLNTPVNIERIGLNDNLEDYGIDSISFIKIVVAIEKEFGFVFGDEDLFANNFPTLKSLIEYVSLKQAETQEEADNL